MTQFQLLPPLFALNAIGVPEMSGCQSNGLSQSATGSLESPLLLFHPVMKRRTTLMIQLT
jgi:hypothetical protein